LNQYFLECGPFTASAPDGRILYRDVEVSIGPCFVLLYGASGCGKTTLLRQIAGLAPSDKARRVIKGQEYGADRLPEWRSRVTLMAQDAPVLRGSVEENLVFPFGLKNAGKRIFDRAKASKLMEQTGLGHVSMDQRAKSLSGGERHRLNMIRALLWDPDVLLADEPLTGLDVPTAEKCFSLLRDFTARGGKAVICVLHDLEYRNQVDVLMHISDSGIQSGP